MCPASAAHHFSRLVAGATVLLISLPALGLVLHTDDEPADRPSDAVVGRWGSNASSVLISPNMVLSTRHQGGGVGTPVEIAGATYLVAEIFNHYKADLRVARIVTLAGNSANLLEWAKVYAGTSDTQRPVVMGGYGKGRGSTKYTSAGVAYAYDWAGSGNSTLRWGANYVDMPVWEFQVGLLRSKGLRADFDDVGEGGHVPHEAAQAVYDSGSGWFILEDSRWQVVALSAFVEHQNETWFRDATTGELDPDHLYAVRVGGYTDWIMETATSSVIRGDATGDGTVDGVDYTVVCDHVGQTGLPPWSEGGWVFANFNEDDTVDGGDYTIWADHYTRTVPGSGSGIPEPVTAAVLVAGALPLLRRPQRG